MEDESSSVIEAQTDLALPRYALRGFGATDLGSRHDINEDSHAIVPTHVGGALLVVCDGMGGMGRGDQASALALRRIVDALASSHEHPLDAATHAIHAADRELVRAFQGDESGRRPGTTCAIVHVEHGVAYGTWVGDSTILVIRDGAIVAKSRPHRVVQDLIDANAMTPEEARVSPMGRFLARSLGGRSPDEPVVEPSMLQPWRLVAGDVLVLCSDGLTDFVSHDEIATIVREGADEADTTRALIQRALAHGVDDNVTVIVARCVDATKADEATFLAPAWDSFPHPEEDEPDYHSDIRSYQVPDAPSSIARPIGVLTVAALVFGVGAALLALVGGILLLAL